MKLHKSLLLFGASALLLTACGEETNTEEEAATESEVEEVATEPEEAVSEPVEETPVEDPTTEQPQQLDENNVVISYPYAPLEQFNILNTERTTGSMTDADILVLEMEYTNLGDQPQSPYMDFVSNFDVWQTDGTTTTSLMGANGELGNLENQEAVEMGDANVNPGATVSAIIGYRLEYPDQVVSFTYRPSQISGEPIGFSID